VAVKTIKAQAHGLPHRNAGYSDTMPVLERPPWRRGRHDAREGMMRKPT
jgi:hypothetical protein